MKRQRMKSSECAMFIEWLDDNTDPTRVWDNFTDIKQGRELFVHFVHMYLYVGSQMIL